MMDENWGITDDRHQVVLKGHSSFRPGELI
jgi:hypothetical protein